jgi:NDP-sugar pyrophosphorylase family protein
MNRPDALDAFVFAAGLGTRMGPLSAALPKPAWTLGGRPLLQWAGGALARAGCASIACNAHHGADVIRSMADGMEVIEETTLLGTGEPLRRLAGRAAPEGLLVWNADVVADVPWKLLRGAHAADGAGVTWLLVPHPGGDWTELYMDSGGRVLPRGTAGPRGPYLFTGAACWGTGALGAIPEGCFDVRDFLASYPGHRGIVAEPFRWLEIGTPDQLIRAASELAPGREGRVPGCYIHPAADESRKIRRCILGPGASLGPDAEDSDAFWYFDGRGQVRLELV